MESFLAMYPPELLMVLVTIFVAAGSVKGLAGFGMPLFAIPMITILYDVPITLAMGWSMGPIFLTNIVQLVMSRQHYRAAFRLGPLFLPMFIAMLLTVQVLRSIDSDWLSFMVGLVVLISVLSQLVRPWEIKPETEKLFLAVNGLISGIIGGLTSFMGFPALQAMLALRLSPGEFVFSVSFMFLVGAGILGGALASFNLMTGLDLVVSALLIVPSLIGLRFGQWVRRFVPVETFRKIVLGILIINGCSLILGSLF